MSELGSSEDKSSERGDANDISSDSQDSQYEFEESKNTKVLVTGANGYLGSHIIQQLLEKGVYVKAAVHKKKNSDCLNQWKKDFPGQIEIHELEIQDFVTKWKKLAAGCTGIIHTAMPNMYHPPKKDLDVVYPTVEGVMNIITAASEEGVTKVVITGSTSTLSGGKYKQNFIDDDWGDPDAMTSIEKAKYLAEKTAWGLLKDLHNKTELTVINPGYMIGPSLNSDCTFASGQLVRKICEGRIEEVLKMQVASVDVRNVAEAHIKALWSRKSNGKRYICVENSHWLMDLTKEIKERYLPMGFEYCEKEASSFSLLLGSFFDPRYAAIKRYYNKECYFSNSLIIDDLNLDFKPFSQSIQDMMVDLYNKDHLQMLEPLGEADLSPTQRNDKAPKGNMFSNFVGNVGSVFQGLKDKVKGGK